jgi:hypothetical protein
VKSALLAILVAIAVVAASLLAFYPQQTSGTNSAPNSGSLKGIPPFEDVAQKVSLGQLSTHWTSQGYSMYVPTGLPNKLSLVSVYAEFGNGSVGNTAILVYSNTGDGSPESAELTIEVTPATSIPFRVEDTATQRFTSINGWSAFIDTQAPVSWAQYYVKYGTNQAKLVDVYVGGLNYEFVASPSINLPDLTGIVMSMAPVS